jgi:DNA repair exonuclease SbcCD ATPase subunit
MARCNASLAGFAKQIKDLEEEISKLRTEASIAKQDNSSMIEDLKTKLNTQKEEMTDLEKQARVFSMAGKLLKDGGIKARVIKQYIPVMNGLINKYLAMLNFFVKFELDEEFNETIKSRFRDDFQYDNFSEGEKTRINVAILFAWRAIAKMRNAAATNLLIMDEILDGSLDNIGVEEFLKLMDDGGNIGQSLFVVSHRGEVLMDKFDRTIRFVKHKNYSSAEEV